MSILDRLNKRPAPAAAASDAEPTPSSGELPIPDYDRLEEKQIARLLGGLSQVQLNAVLAYEDAHKARPVVLDKLKYLRTAEPLPDYDALEPDQIRTALEGADGQTLRAVRDYERKFRRRGAVTSAITEALPTSHASAKEAAATAEKADRVSAKMAAPPSTS